MYLLASIKVFFRQIFSKYILQWINYREMSGSVVLVCAALLVGITSGSGVLLFKKMIVLTHWGIFNGFGFALLFFGHWTFILVPVMPLLGGLIVGLIVHFSLREDRYHGVAGVMEAVALAGGRLCYRLLPAKTIAASLSIGSGASVGPEDPSVQIGSNLGSMFGQLLRFSDDRIRALVAAGAAGGIAAAFNAPIAGVFFALEIIIGELSSKAFGVITLAAVVSSVFTQAMSGTEPAFHVPAYAFHSAWELPFYLGLGVMSGPVSAIYIRFLYAARDIFNRWNIPRWLKTAIAGLIVGLVGICLPQMFGEGYETIENILDAKPPTLNLLLLLLMAKLVLTPISIGGGFFGGVFAPSLFLGATLGGAYGLIVQQFFPALNIAPPAFAMVGMAAVLAGAVHAPITAIILLFEMTNNYRIILPLMFAVTISLFISRYFQRDSVYTFGLARKGIRLEHGRVVDILESIMVDEIMEKKVITLREADSLGMASDLLLQTRHHSLPVLNETGELSGILTVQDIERIQNDVNIKNRTVGENCTRDLLVANPDETIGVALRRMGIRDLDSLPVVLRKNPRYLVGLLSSTDIVRAYDLALTRREQVRHRAHQVHLSDVGGVNVEKVTVESGAPCTNKHIREVVWPREAIIATIRRGRKILIPDGDTILKVGDVLVVVADIEIRDQIQRLCSSAGDV
ncbi:MAG: chloride channel protein [Candidatus Brocadia sp.]|nr:chloride channel protein [Candidatus Brocadia sp.]